MGSLWIAEALIYFARPVMLIQVVLDFLALFTGDPIMPKLPTVAQGPSPFDGGLDTFRRIRLPSLFPSFVFPCHIPETARNRMTLPRDDDHRNAALANDRPPNQPH